MLATIGFIILVVWLVGLLAHVGGGLINILLVIGLIVVAMHFLRGRRARV